MDIFIQAVVLGIVEGITEFLPISSTGHLIIVNRFVGFEGEFAELFDIVIQLGAILSVVIYFWGRLVPFGGGKSAQQRSEVWTTWYKTIVAVLPALALGAVLEPTIKRYLFSPGVVAVALFVGGMLLIYIERRHRRPTTDSVAAMTYRLALAIGCIQCLAMLPGTSRSAATIIGAMLLGASRAAATEFSFFLAIPTMVAASGYSVLKHGASLTGLQWEVLAVGFVVSFLVAWAVVAFLMSYIRKHDFQPFGWYRIALGALVLALMAMGQLAPL